jgi:hypothetical protein
MRMVLFGYSLAPEGGEGSAYAKASADKRVRGVWE